ncbi:MAG: hypothetical protein VR67_01175 [Peptococcaceae bacterium BRH_c8a]|nr:MAG: hypothetical protein VR67_01175 [Peptococcaceae bacterium BRH_c8a]
MWLAAVIMVTVLVFVIILLSPVKVEIKYTYYRFNAPLSGTPQEYVPDRGVRFSLLWGLINLRLKLSYFKLAHQAFTPVLKLRARFSKRSGATLAKEKTRLTAGRAIELYRQALKFYRATKPAYRFMLSRTTLHHFKWSTGLGLPEAGQTGMAVGALWVIKSNTTSFLYRMLDRQAPMPELEVVPVFDGQLLRVNFDCIFSLRSGHIIYTGILVGWFFLINRRKF